MATQPTDLVYQQHADIELRLTREPEQALNDAHLAAKALQKRIAGKEKPVIFNGKQYIERDDWEMVAHFFGYVSKVESTSFVEYGNVQGFQAVAQLINEQTKAEVSRAVAICLNDEDNWGLRPKYDWKDVIRDGKKVWNEQRKKYERERVQVGEEQVPMFQLLSMAQTRACAKACRNKLGWIVVLAGYEPTPAEEMNGTTLPESGQQTTEKPLATVIERKHPSSEPSGSRPATQQARPAQQPLTPSYDQTQPAKAQPQATRQSATAAAPRLISDGQARRFWAIWHEGGKTQDQVTHYLATVIGVQHDSQIPVARYVEACAWAERR